MNVAFSETGNDRIVPGGNNPPAELTPFEAISAEADDLVLEAEHWADGEPITSADIAEACTGLFEVVTNIIVRAEAIHEAEVKPINDAKNAVQAKFHPLIGDTKTGGKGRLITAKATLGELLTAWRTRENERKAAEAETARREAAAIAKQAEDAMRASSGNLGARVDAEQLLSSAKIADRDARRVEKAATTRTGLRTSFRPMMNNGGLAAEHYWKTRRADFQAFLQDCAAQDVRKGIRQIPGFDVIEEKTAI